MKTTGYNFASQPAKTSSVHFTCQAENHINHAGVFCPFYSGWDAPCFHFFALAGKVVVGC